MNQSFRFVNNWLRNFVGLHMTNNVAHGSKVTHPTSTITFFDIFFDQQACTKIIILFIPVSVKIKIKEISDLNKFI